LTGALSYITQWANGIWCTYTHEYTFYSCHFRDD